MWFSCSYVCYSTHIYDVSQALNRRATDAKAGRQWPIIQRHGEGLFFNANRRSKMRIGNKPATKGQDASRAAPQAAWALRLEPNKNGRGGRVKNVRSSRGVTQLCGSPRTYSHYIQMGEFGKISMFGRYRPWMRVWGRYDDRFRYEYNLSMYIACGNACRT